MDHEALDRGECDDPGGAGAAIAGHRQDFAGAAHIHALAGLADAAAEEIAEGIHGAGDNRHLAAADDGFADHLGQLEQRRQLAGGANDAVEEARDIAMIGPDLAPGRERIGHSLAGEVKEAKILGCQHMHGAGPEIGMMALEPGHLGHHMAGADGDIDARAPPLGFFGGGYRGIDGGGLGLGAHILPDDGGGERDAIGIDEDVGIDLAAEAEPGNARDIDIGNQCRKAVADAIQPVIGVLLDHAEAGTVGGIGAAPAGDHRALGGEDAALDLGRADVEADIEITLSHRGLPANP